MITIRKNQISTLRIIIKIVVLKDHIDEKAHKIKRL